MCVLRRCGARDAIIGERRARGQVMFWCACGSDDRGMVAPRVESVTAILAPTLLVECVDALHSERTQTSQHAPATVAKCLEEAGGICRSRNMLLRQRAVRNDIR